MPRPRHPFETEAQLCAAFIIWAQKRGYSCYPETAGWDILMVDTSGFQIGIQAKLKLNARVICQALDRYGADVGPDHRAVLVPTVDGDLRQLCAHIGIEIFFCTSPAEWHYSKPHDFFHDGGWLQGSMFDWNPVKRHRLPGYIPDVAAGVPSPVQLTSWKIGALKILARIEIYGSITREHITGYGVDPKRWCNADRWLVPLDGDQKRGGRWLRGEKCPPFDQQHPDVYAKIKAEAVKAGPGPGQLALEMVSAR